MEPSAQTGRSQASEAGAGSSNHGQGLRGPGAEPGLVLPAREPTEAKHLIES